MCSILLRSWGNIHFHLYTCQPELDPTTRSSGGSAARTADEAKTVGLLDDSSY